VYWLVSLSLRISVAENPMSFFRQWGKVFPFSSFYITQEKCGLDRII
jgi:hypothetical protein